MKTKRDNKQAISLIVLVITIIVMIILASAIILTLNNNGIIGKANEAIDETNEDTIREMAYIAWLEAYADGVRTVEDVDDKKGFKSRVDAALKEIDATDYNVKVTTSGVDVSLKEKIVSVVDTVDGVPIPKGFVASQATGENKKDTGLVIYEGTEAVTDANVFNAKRERNQYVWVPVDTANFDATFVRKGFIDTIDKALTDVLGKQYMFWEVLPTTELNTKNLKYTTEETLEEVQAMYASVKKYGGFYIARYEIGLDIGSHKTNDDGVIIKNVHSKMNKAPYNYVRWAYGDNMSEDTNGAVEVARSIYPESNKNYGVVSTLVYGVQWDRTLAWWIETKAQNGTKDVIIESNTELKDSANYGNHKDSEIANSTFNAGASVSKDDGITYIQIDESYYKPSGEAHLLTTGATEKTRVNNIYNMAGNVAEWTMEGYDQGFSESRGSAYTSTNNVITRAGSISPEVASYHIGFRTALYIK